MTPNPFRRVKGAVLTAGVAALALVLLTGAPIGTATAQELPPLEPPALDPPPLEPPELPPPPDEPALPEAPELEPPALPESPDLEPPAFEPPALPAEPPALPIDEPSLPGDDPSLPTDAPSLPVDEPALPAPPPGLPIPPGLPGDPVPPSDVSGPIDDVPIGPGDATDDVGDGVADPPASEVTVAGGGGGGTKAGALPSAGSGWQGDAGDWALLSGVSLLGLAATLLPLGLRLRRI